MFGFRASVRNTWRGTARGATLSDQLPEGLVWAVVPPVTGCAVDGAGLLTCSFGDIPADAGVALHVRAGSSPCCQYLTDAPSAAATNDPNAGITSLRSAETLRPAGDVNASCGGRRRRRLLPHQLPLRGRPSPSLTFRVSSALAGIGGQAVLVPESSHSDAGCTRIPGVSAAGTAS